MMRCRTDLLKALKAVDSPRPLSESLDLCCMPLGLIPHKTTAIQDKSNQLAYNVTAMWYQSARYTPHANSIIANDMNFSTLCCNIYIFFFCHAN